MTEVQPVEEEPGKLNLNRYATKKTIAQGMLDIALLTANASQLKYVLNTGPEKHPFYYLMLTLISISIILQVLVGVCMLFLGVMKVDKTYRHFKRSDLLNNIITIGIFLISVINIVISGFGIETQAR